MGELLRLPVFAFLLLFLTAGTLPAQAKKGGEKPAAKPAKAAKAAPKAEAAPKTEEADAAAKDAAPADAAGDSGAAGPELKPSDFWILGFKPQRIGMIQPTEGIHHGETYWYLVYTIENKTGQDRSAYISVTARSNKGKSYAAIYLPDLETMIERKVGKPLWGKADVYASITGGGKDAADAGDGEKKDRASLNYSNFKAKEVRDCVAVFNQLDPNASKITITVDGLSNDLHLVERENGGRQIESRALVLEYERPGDEYEMNLDQFRPSRRAYWLKKVTEVSGEGGAKAAPKAKADGK